MPNKTKQSRVTGRPGLGALLQEVVEAGRNWAEAELALARTELDDLRRRCVAALILAGVALAALLTALVVLAQTGVAIMTLYLGSEMAGGAAVGALLLLLAALCVMLMMRMVRWRAESPLFHWLTPRRKGTSS